MTREESIALKELIEKIDRRGKAREKEAEADVVEEQSFPLDLYCPKSVLVHRNDASDRFVISLIIHDATNAIGHFSKFFQLFAALPLHSQQSANHCISIELDSSVTDEQEVLSLVRAIHAQMLNEALPLGWFSSPSSSTTRRTAVDAAPAAAPLPWLWWQKERRKLITEYSDKTPLYVNSLRTIEEAAKRLLAVRSVRRFFYAIKANNHPQIIRTLLSLGIGMETVSIGELKHVLDIMNEEGIADAGVSLDAAGRRQHRVLFTPNFCSRQEYEQAFATDRCWITVDCVHPLRHWPEVFTGRAIFLRIDPGGTGHGHHAHVRTAGEQSKFGIPIETLGAVAELCRRQKITVCGLHAHAGSGILNAHAWSDTAALLVSLRGRHFPDAVYFDIGGGLGVVHGADGSSSTGLDLDAVDESLSQCAAQISKSFNGELWMEPGRYLVAEAGILLATVTQVKDKEHTRYVGCDTGFNTLLRPILYDAYHPIVNLSAAVSENDHQEGQSDLSLVTVCGNICETGDVLGSRRLLPAETSEGDLLLIGLAGAYGRTMSMHYNMRDPAKSICH